MDSAGWYAYVQTEQKKSKPELRWLTVSEYWLGIAEKPKAFPLFTFNLGFCTHYPTKDDKIHPNSITLETNSYAGKFKIQFHTFNRFDILEICKALKDGAEKWTEYLNTDSGQTRLEVSFKDRKQGLFGKSIECVIDDHGFTKMGSNQVHYSYDDIVTIRPTIFEKRKGSCFEMNTSDGTEYIFQSHGYDEMKSVVSLILKYKCKTTV